MATETLDRARAYLARVPGSPEGGRDHATIAAACKAVERFNLPEDTLLEVLLEWNEAQNAPPLPDAQVRKCLRSALARTAFDPDLANGPANPGQRPRPAARSARPAPAPKAPAQPLPSAADLDAATRELCDGTGAEAHKAREYLASTGINPAACGWGLARLTPRAAAKHGLARGAAGWRLLVPVYLPDGTLADVRRYAGPFGGEPRVTPWADGTGTAKPYGWGDPQDDPFADTPTDADELVWCEGERDCEALHALGMTAVSNTNGANAAASVARALPADLLEAKRFTLLFDHDQAGRDGAAKLAAELAARGAEVRIASWPETLPDGQPTPAGFDVCDWVTRFDPAEIAEVLAQAVPYAAPAPAGRPGDTTRHHEASHDPHDAEEGDDGTEGHEYLAKPRVEPSDYFTATDDGNARRFKALCGHRFLYCHDWETWLVYDGTRWAIDTTNRAMAAARAVARSILLEAHAAPEHQSSELAKWYRQSLRRPQLSAMLDLARSDLPILSGGLDTDPWSLNCANGTLDLRTGALRPHDPADRITRITRAAYRPDAHLADTAGASAWLTFVGQLTAGDDELAAFLQRAIGYSLTGDPRDEVLFFCYGPARTGKSTFLEAVKHVAGDYGESVDFTAFLRKRDDSELKPEIVKLQGRRFVTSSETNAGRTLAEGLVKTITGGDEVSVRGLRRDPITFRPAFTLWLAANDRPTVRHDDDAMWRRVKVVPFLNQVPANQADTGLKSRLRAEAGEAILAWAIAGCLEWQRHGLGTCAAVEAAIAEYQEAMDPLGGWLEERCAIDAQKTDWFAPTALLFRDYQAWCGENNETTTMTTRDFGTYLGARGLSAARRRFEGKVARCFEGIRLTAQLELDLDDDHRGES